LILGRHGQLGRALASALSPLGRLILAGRGAVDPKSPRAALSAIRPTVIVNAAAYTKVDLAESHEAEAAIDNALLPGALAAWAAEAGALLVHYSTDYVFDGKKDGPYLETDAPAPLNAYGRTKLAGDEAVLGAGGRCLVFRTSWVYSLIGQNFPKTILGLARQKAELVINDDQVGAPVSADLLAAVTALAVARHQSAPESAPVGLMNLASQGETSWLGFARWLVEKARELRMPIPEGLPRLLPAYGPDPSRPALRPLNSRLDCSKASEALGLHLPHWTHHAERLLEDLAAIGPAA
jgi:dTDP-4-dehydrorhamnose reductase